MTSPKMMLLLALATLGHVTFGDVIQVTESPPITQEPTTFFPTEPPEVAGPPDIRLPRSLKPLHYVLKLQPFLNGNLSISGYVEVEVEVLESTSNITLHMADIVSKNDTVKVKRLTRGDKGAIRIKKQEYDPESHFYIAHLKEDLEKGKRYSLSMEYVAYLNDQLRGFYRSTYTDNKGNMRTIATTQFQPTDARRAFPCFDEPGLKATFEVHLARENWMVALSNMPLVRTYPVEGQEGWVWDRFEKSVPMSTYLVAFVISNFAHLRSFSKENVLFRVWARKSALEQAEYATKVGLKMLTFFEEYFELPFPLPKQDMIALPDAAGAMENWGLITYSESVLLYNPRVSTPSSKQSVALTISHELAHNWFGNLVTPVWWDDLWLNEGFAVYLSALGLDYAEPSWKVLETTPFQDLHFVLDRDGYGSSHRISIPVNHPDEINEIFDVISYKKGSSIVRMMAHFLNEATFRKGLSNYLKAFAYGNAVQDDLWQYMTAAAHEDGTLPKDVTVKMIMDTWTLQKGYPVINVLRSADGTSAIVSQERFIADSTQDSTDDHNYRWWVPLTYTSQEEANFNATQAMVWVKDTEEHLTIPSLPPKDQWVMFNLQETGYYRVNYDHHNWNLLIHQLNDNHQLIHPVNRAKIINDAMSFAKIGQLNYRTVFRLSAYLKKETEYLPWSVASNQLDYIESLFRKRGAYGALKRYILDLVLPLYNSVGFKDNLDDPHLEQRKRRIAVEWACKLGHRDCLDKVVTLYRQWMDDPENDTIISPNLKTTIYCQGIAEGGEAEWDFAWNRYLKSNVASEKSIILRTLACTKETWLLSRYLEMATSTGSAIRLQDMYAVLQSIGSKHEGRSLIWEYLTVNWNNIFTHRKNARGSVLRAITEHTNTKQDLQSLERFLSRRSIDLKGNERNAQYVTERTKANVAWMEANYEAIVKWLEEHGYSSKVRTP